MAWCNRIYIESAIKSQPAFKKELLGIGAQILDT